MTDRSASPRARPIVPTWGDGETRAAGCPVCGSSGDKRVLLTCASVLDRDAKLTFLTCDDCASVFVQNFEEPDYTRYWIEDEGIRFYVEQGAGVDVLIRTPQCFRGRENVRYCEVGCGFGFSIDYARLMNGWDAIGIDPSPIAKAGRELLGLDIVPEYLSSDPSRLGKFDLLMTSEVIEHIVAPDAFMAALRAHLAPGGVVVLSTPSANALRPEVGPGVVVPALSPGYHAVIYSPDGLRRLLTRAGFTHIAIEERDTTLYGVASDAPFDERPWLPPEPVDSERYFRERIALERDGSLVDIGMRTRLHRSLVNRGAFEEAAVAFEDLRLSIIAAYRFDIADPAAVASILQVLDGCDLAEFVRTSPAGLASALYAHGIACHLGGGSRARALHYLALAGRAAVLLRDALAPHGADDGDAGVISWSAEDIRIHVLAFEDPAAAAADLVSFLRTPETPRYRVQSQDLLEKIAHSLYNHILRVPGSEHAVAILDALEDIPGRSGFRRVEKVSEP